jgi:peroxiredoxin
MSIEVPRPGVNDDAPDVSLWDMAEHETHLSSRWQRQPSVVVFLRYFGCPFCQAQVVKLRDERDRFDETGAGIVLIGQGAPSDAAEFTERMAQPFECLVDPDLSAYKAFGLGTARLGQVFGPPVALPFLRDNLRRETFQRGLHGGKFMQMPGTFVIDTQGVVQLAHRNRHIADTPPHDEILRVLNRLRVSKS